jgi:hypothetical protein
MTLAIVGVLRKPTGARRRAAHSSGDRQSGSNTGRVGILVDRRNNLFVRCRRFVHEPPANPGLISIGRVSAV